MTQPLSLSAVRAIALHAQQLLSSPKLNPTIDDIYNTVERIGCVQIDTLQMVSRSHYLVLWSRLGQYNPDDFDRLVYSADNRRLFEHWLRAASIIPLKDYRYSLAKMRSYVNHDGWERALSKDETRNIVEMVRQRIREDGAARGGDFEYTGEKRGSWWDWKPAKLALEYLYSCGELMIADRVKFQRVYDLKERVLPDWVDTTEPTEDELYRFRIEQGAKMLGIGEAMHTADYTYHSRTKSKPYISDMIKEGVLVEIKGETFGGKVKTLVVHRDNLPLVEQAADGKLKPSHTTFLSPFDSLFWAKRRDMLFWNFFQTLEAYVPEPKRIWGYFSLPILHKDRLVGRFDPKLERKTGNLRIKALHLEQGVEPDDELVTDMAAALRDFMAFHKATTLEIEKSNPPEFGEKLAKMF